MNKTSARFVKNSEQVLNKYIYIKIKLSYGSAESFFFDHMDCFYKT